MFKSLFILAWILVGFASVAPLLDGDFDPAMQIALSVAVLTLVYAFALWSVMRRHQDPRLTIWGGRDV